MQIDVVESADVAAARGAALIAREAAAAVASRGRACVAVSGGRTPWTMLRELAGLNLPWDRTTFFQVDERDCPVDDDSRNYRHLRESLPARARLVPMPVEHGEAGAAEYVRLLRDAAGTPPVLDVVHLGLGPDGHTASLVPGDAVLSVRDRDVAWTGAYQGHRRMTLTYPAVDRARLCFWLVTGAEKRDALARLVAGDPGVPAAGVGAARMLVIADAEAAGAPRTP